MKFDGNVFTHSTLEEGYDFFITDKWNKKRHFKISTFPHAGGLLSEAIEVVVGINSEPYLVYYFRHLMRILNTANNLQFNKLGTLQPLFKRALACIF